MPFVNLNFGYASELRDVTKLGRRQDFSRGVVEVFLGVWGSETRIYGNLHDLNKKIDGPEGLNRPPALPTPYRRPWT